MKNNLRALMIFTALSATALFATSCASTGGGTTASVPGVKAYTKTTCLVTDNDLGSMGDEQRLVHQGQEIKFCCKPCEAKFLKNPEKYLKKLN